MSELKQYEEHLRTEHSNHATGEYENSMISAGESALDSPDRCCPICLLSIETTGALQNHIALHLERFAIFSIPRSVDGKDDINEGDSEKANRAAEGSREHDFDQDSNFDRDHDEESSASSVATRRVEFQRKFCQTVLNLSKAKGASVSMTIHESMQSAIMKWMGNRYQEQLTQDIMHDRAVMHLDNGEMKVAETMFQQMQAIRILVLGKEHPLTLASMQGLTSTYSKQGRHDDAIRLGREVWEIQEKVLGHVHPDTCFSMENLVTMLLEQNILEEAEKLSSELIRLRREMYGKVHSDTIRAMAILSATYCRQNRFKDAEELADQVLRLCRQIPGAIDIPYKILNSLCDLLGNMGKFEDLEWLLAQSWNSRNFKKTLLATIYSIGCLLIETKFINNHVEEAINLAEDVAYNLIRVLGVLDPTTVKMKNLLSSLYTSWSRHTQAMNVHYTILRDITSDSGDEIPRNELCEAAISQIELLRRTYQRLGTGGWDKDSKLYSDLFQQLNVKFEGEETWKSAPSEIKNPAKWQAFGADDLGVWQRPKSFKFMP
ncbi:hypothetical protein NHQ30_006240 [Ciborinia camelliae]|nr:hypothetical protein NHQ30_006240 [Ciborinia camelliae]